MSQRIHSIDAVRAVALLAILLVHCHDSYSAATDGAPAGAFDLACDWVYEHLLLAKSFMVFSFLFGLSFFLQMDHAAARGVDFRARFCWRLTLLFGFGLLHLLFYCGDILTIFAPVGLLLVLLWRHPRWAVGLCVLFLLQPFRLGEALADAPEAVLGACYYSVSFLGIQLSSMPDFATASWGEVAAWNLTDGSAHRWLFQIFSGRLCGVISMFLLGMLAGRYRLFEGTPRRLLTVAAIAAVPYALCLWGQEVAPEPWRELITWWGNEAYVMVLLPMLAWFFGHAGVLRRLRALTAIGRCTLSCYVMQSVIMCALLYGWGLNLASQLSVSARMGIGGALFLLQLGACVLWLRHFRYGPLEGLWRRLTRLGMRG